MEEIKIQIEVIKAEMQALENKVDDFSRYNRSPNESDYLVMIQLLSKWSDKRQQLSALKDVAEAIRLNNL